VQLKAVLLSKKRDTNMNIAIVFIAQYRRRRRSTSGTDVMVDMMC
jgi:hypothetical protein